MSHRQQVETNRLLEQQNQLLTEIRDQLHADSRLLSIVAQHGESIDRLDKQLNPDDRPSEIEPLDVVPPVAQADADDVSPAEAEPAVDADDATENEPDPETEPKD